MPHQLWRYRVCNLRGGARRAEIMTHNVALLYDISLRTRIQDVAEMSDPDFNVKQMIAHVQETLCADAKFTIK